MKHVIIGTAGHVDHGKTALIRALTGIDTDRLPEEKKRGITVDLGFAYLPLLDGGRAGIVDVPGHERFIHNMLAGAGGIDLGMLVVAADEGVMPQTREHLAILSLLGLRSGLTVITKTDRVSSVRIGEVRRELKETLKNTFLEDRPVLEVSSYTGEGLPALRETLYALIAALPEKDAGTPFRLPADRVFSPEGFGTVVTGTLIEGRLREGDTVELAPAGLSARVRGLQVHGETVKEAFAGQRTAVNLAGVKKEDVRRGDMLVSPGSVSPSRRLDVRLVSLKDSGRELRTGMTVHFYHGTSKCLARLSLYGTNTLRPGESCYAALVPDAPVVCKNGDRFVIRFYSPLETVGGGTVLDACPKERRKNCPATVRALAVLENGTGAEKVLQALTGPATIGSLRNALPGEADTLADTLDALVSSGRALQLTGTQYVSAAYAEDAAEKCRAALDIYHKKEPLRAGMPVRELAEKAFPGADRDAMLRLLGERHVVSVREGCAALPGFAVQFTPKQTAAKEKLLAAAKEAGTVPVPLTALDTLFAGPDRATARQVFASLVSGGQLIRLDREHFCGRDAYEAVLKAVRTHLAKHGTLTLAEARDRLGVSRKYALLYLEYLDKAGVTVKEGDRRKRADKQA